MSIGKRNKDYLKDSVDISRAPCGPESQTVDPLRFWTRHPTENTYVDLRPFAEGEHVNKHPFGGGNWAGAYSGRPQLIAELLPALQARLILAAPSTVSNYKNSLRAWWRFFDRIETIHGPNGNSIPRVDSIACLNALHEVAAHRDGILPRYFQYFLSIANDARRVHKPRLPELLWVVPKFAEPNQTLIPDDQAREVKTCLKQNWERVRRGWANNDIIRAELERRKANNTNPEDNRSECADLLGVSDQEERLLTNLQHLVCIQKKSGRILPTSEQLLDGCSRSFIWGKGIELRLMRSIVFPTTEEAETAFHLALMNSGWNPTTLARIDGSSPDLVLDHPKDPAQIILRANADEEDEVTIQADKPRARGKTQFCSGLKKHMSSPPVIVSTYLVRVAALRKQLQSDYEVACVELKRMQAENVDHDTIVREFERVQRLKQGSKSVWLYVDAKGEISWLDPLRLCRYQNKAYGGELDSYIARVLKHLNSERNRVGKPLIAPITPSDFRDIYARWVYKQSGGNILSVMLALGHSSPRSTGRYLDNNIFSAENDEAVRGFMTHLFVELERGRLDLTILTQLVRHGAVTVEMQQRLDNYRKLMRSRVGVACIDPRHPPADIVPEHNANRLCETQNCLRRCGNARLLPESLDGIAMRVEELCRMSDCLPRETWLRGKFADELNEGEYLLENLYKPEQAAEARDNWRSRIAQGEHLVPGLGFATDIKLESV